jgi:predicted nucleic-acid-binding Zn-ribbon protein
VKDRHPCPKCGYRKILFLPQIADRTESIVPSALAAHVAVTGMVDALLGPTVYGRITAYVCRRCGFTELYTASPKSIPYQDIAGAKIIEADAEEEDDEDGGG